MYTFSLIVTNSFKCFMNLYFSTIITSLLNKCTPFLTTYSLSLFPSSFNISRLIMYKKSSYRTFVTFPLICLLSHLPPNTFVQYLLFFLYIIHLVLFCLYCIHFLVIIFLFPSKTLHTSSLDLICFSCFTLDHF